MKRATLRALGLYCVLAIAIVVCTGQCSAQSNDGDVYFGTLGNYDPGSGIVSMDVWNINIRQKAKGVRTFRMAPDAEIGIWQLGAGLQKGQSLSNLSDQRWIWIVSPDGENGVALTATAYEGFKGVVKSVSPDTVEVQLLQRSIGRRYWNYSKKTPRRTFHIPSSTPCEFQKQPASLSSIRPGTTINVLTKYGSAVVNVTIY